MDMEAASDNSSVEDKGTRCQECQASAATHGLKVDAIERWCFECSKDHELAVNLQPAPGFLAEKELREQRKQRVQLEHNKSLSLSHARIAQRERLKGDMDAEKRMLKKKEAAWRKRQSLDNLRKSSKSPFHMDLVAETERIDEEVQVRLQFEEQMGAAETKRKMKVMDAVIRSALVEDDHVALLREEKRKLLIEEKRLKAVAGSMKSDANLQRKKDMIAETTRQRRMQAELASEKRKQVVERQLAERQRRVEALKYRHAVKPNLDIAV